MEDKSVTIPRELFDFLMGAGEIVGTSFGELNSGLPGRFWWRALLRTAEASSRSEAQATGLREALEDARACLIDHLQYMKEPDSARIIKRIDAALEGAERHG